MHKLRPMIMPKTREQLLLAITFSSLRGRRFRRPRHLRFPFFSATDVYILLEIMSEKSCYIGGQDKPQASPPQSGNQPVFSLSNRISSSKEDLEITRSNCER